MKKLLTLLLVMMISIFVAGEVFADEDHVVMDDHTKYLTDEDYKELNDDLARIEERYDINIYFLIDDTIKANDLSSYALSYLDARSRCTNNVILAISGDRYVILANGKDRNDVLSRSEEIFASYNGASRYVEGIRNYYQKVVEIINAKNYDSKVPVLAQPLSVYDAAGLLSAEQQKALMSRLDDIKRKTGMEVVVVTADDLNGMSVDDYADDFYDYNGYGEDGILMLLAMKDRDWYFSTSGKASDYFSYEGIDIIADRMLDDLREGNYYEAFNIFADQAEEVIQNGGDEYMIDPEPEPEEKHFGLGNLSISALFAALTSAITGGVLKGQLKNTHKQRYAQNYIVDRSFVLTGRSDMLVDSRVSRTPRHQDNDRGSSSGGGGRHTPVHTSSSGHSHGGHGGKF